MSVQDFLKTSELFKSEVGDEIFMFTRENPHRLKQLIYLESMYQRTKAFLPEVDYSVRFANDFVARWWEMHLIDGLIQAGNAICPPVNHGPDICLESGDCRIWIEAVSLKQGDGPDRMPEPVYGTVMNVPTEPAILRFTNAVNAKNLKIQGYIRDGIISSDDKVIIAVNTSSLPMADLYEDPPLAVKSLLGVGHLTMMVSTDPKQTGIKDSFYARRESIFKKNKSEIDANGFMTGELQEISGVLTNYVNFMYMNTDSTYWNYLENPSSKRSFDARLLSMNGTFRRVQDGRLEVYNP